MFGKAKPPQTSWANACAELSPERPNRRPRPTRGPDKSNARFLRRRSGKALILADGEKRAVAVKDISATGARIEYFVRRELPDFVTLVEPTLRIKSRARVAWQRDGVAGLAFVRD